GRYHSRSQWVWGTTFTRRRGDAWDAVRSPTGSLDLLISQPRCSVVPSIAPGTRSTIARTRPPSRATRASRAPEGVPAAVLAAGQVAPRPDPPHERLWAAP